MFATYGRTLLCILIAAVTSLAAMTLDNGSITFTQQERLSNEVPDNFYSRTLDINGDIAVVGSNSGFYVYSRSGDDWTSEGLLIPSDGLSALSSYAVAVRGDTIVIGGSWANIGQNIHQGAAYIFRREGNTWTEQQRLTAPDGAADDQFGGSVAINGDTIVVGAHGDDIGANAEQGSAYVFVYQTGMWIQQSKLLADDGAASYAFGTNAAIDGDTAAIGTFRPTGVPKVYVFVRSGSTWSQEVSLSQCEAATFCRYGATVDIHADTLVVGNPSLAVNGASSAGVLYVYTRSGTGWTQQQRLTAGVVLANDTFGASSSIENDLLIVGAGGNFDHPGSAYIFARNGTTWTEQQRIQINSSPPINLYGGTDALSFDSVHISAIRDSNAG
jgi:hypothetical protein